MKTLSLLALLAAAMLSGATRLAACTTVMNISVYSDGDVSPDGATVYGWSTTEDNSTLCTCSHSDYQATAELETPGGSYINNTQSGETVSVSTPTDGVEGTYYAFGLAGLHCSCAGNIGAGWTQFAIPPPPPRITGIVDNSTGSTTISQGTSGYLAIFGTALTAWGETPTPTVSGDSGLTIGFYWASDTQVNVSYTVAANAAIGPHTVSLQTKQGTGKGTINVVACPTTVSITSQTPAVLSATLPDNFSAGILTGVGMIATLTLGPGSPASYNGASVSENFTDGPPGGCPSPITPASMCVGNSQFKAGPGSVATYYGNTSPSTGNGQFLDKHGTITFADVLSAKAPDYSCKQTCTQTYSACGKQIGSFTITFTFTHSSIDGTPVTQVSAGER